MGEKQMFKQPLLKCYFQGHSGHTDDRIMGGASKAPLRSGFLEKVTLLDFEALPSSKFH